MIFAAADAIAAPVIPIRGTKIMFKMILVNAAKSMMVLYDLP